MATVEAPPEPQHLTALRRANEVRLARAAIKRNVATGATSVAEVLFAPQEAASMPIAELLLSQRRWGEQRVGRFLADVGISETKTLGSFTARQRVMLATML